MSFANLLRKWTERDSRYGARRKNGAKVPLTEEEISSIRAYRRSEVAELPEGDRKLGQVTLDRWTPPSISR